MRNSDGRMQRVGTALLVAAVFAGITRADDVVLPCSRNNTLIETGGDVSNGKGDGIYSGLTLRSGIRRGLIRFDLTSIPAGSTITSTSLELTLIQTTGPDGPATLHRVLADWGEGTSLSGGGLGAAATAGDATWLERFYGTAPWAVAGGDFSGVPSGTTTIVATAGTQTFGSTSGLVADVQAWIDNPGQNFGWAVLGDEQTLQSARRFASREYVVPAQAPRLLVSFTPPTPACPADFNQSGTLTVQDIFEFLGAYFGGAAGADFNGAGGITVQDIFDFLAAYFAGCP